LDCGNRSGVEKHTQFVPMHVDGTFRRPDCGIADPRSLAIGLCSEKGFDPSLGRIRGEFVRRITVAVASCAACGRIAVASCAASSGVAIAIAIAITSGVGRRASNGAR